MSTVDRTNMYEIMEYWLTEIAPKYYDMDDISLNRIGLFGNLNEIQAHAIESIANENSVLYNELFFKRAVLPQSIYAYASHYNVSDTTARPATMSFAIGLNEKTLLEKSISDETGNYFIVDSKSEIIVEDKIKFMLDYDIRISIKKDNSGKYIYQAKYVTENLDNPISPIKSTSNPFLKLAKIRVNTTDYIFVYVTAHQYERIETNKIIYSEDFIEYFTFDIDYDSANGQLADFSVFYREPNNTSFIQLEKRLIDSAATEKPFCFYQFKDANKVNITFSNIARFFRPKFNSELNFVFYNTLGSAGNFTYTGDNVAIDLKSDKYDYRDVIMIAKSTSDSVGGTDKKTYEEIKQDVSIKASTSAVIGTEIDLNKHFEAIKNCSSTLFVKKRDDILDRTFGAFLLMKDNKGNLLPTNTTDLDLYDTDFDLIEESTKRYVLKAGKRFIYKPNSKTLKLVKSTGLSTPKFEYSNPFTIVINKSPFFVEYYLSSINKDYLPDFSEVNDIAYTNFITNNIHIERNAIHEDRYTFTFDAKPNMDMIDVEFANVDPNGKFVSDNGNMKIIGVLYKETGEISHYFDCKMKDYKRDTKTASFESQLVTDDYISTYSSLRITEGIIDLEKPDRENPMIHATDLKVGFLVFIKDDEDHPSKYHNMLPGLDGYTLSNVFKIDEKVDLINNLNKSMYSSVLYDKDESGEIFYHLKEVPFIRHDYIFIKEYFVEFVRKFLSDFTVIREHLAVLTNAFNLSVKFYNTYGKSYYFYINEKTTNKLDRVNLTIKFRITLNPNKIMDEGLKEEIRVFIRSYIESVNDDINLYISNLIKALEVNFRDIRHLKFMQINDYGAEVQSVEKDFPTADLVGKNRLKDFVPEYLNINKKYTGYDKVEHSVDIEFV